MIINLSEIPEEGRHYHYTTETGEINDSINDLVGTNTYETVFFIHPLNSKDFSLSGWIKTKTKELCSYCGNSISFPVNVRFNEILIPPQKMTRDGRYAKPNHFSESESDGLQSFEYSDGMKLNIGDFFHESIALEIPFNPTPEIKENGDCGDCGLNVTEMIKTYSDNQETEQPKNPFSVLKSLKTPQ